MNELEKTRPELEQRAELREKKMKDLHELGERFLRDKSALEARLKKIRGLALPDEQKAELTAEIEGVLGQLREQYDRDVTKKQADLIHEGEEDRKEAEERDRELEELAENLREAKMEASRIDLRSVTEMTEQERQRLREEQADTIRRMNNMQTDARLQQESIRRQPKI